MMRNLMAVAAVSGLMVSAALAQSTMNSSSGGASASVITQQAPNQWLASKFMGTDVIGTDDKKIGDVSDVLLDKSGKVDALIVGVGGFLGIGQKDIALPVSSFQVVAANSGSNNTSSDKLRLSMTKEQLQQQAEFKSANTTTTTGAGSGSNATGQHRDMGAGTSPSTMPSTAPNR